MQWTCALPQDCSHFSGLLNRFLAACVQGVRRSPLQGQHVDSPPLASLGSEVFNWGVRLTGKDDQDQKAREDALAVGDLRNAGQSVSRLHLVSPSGRALGKKLSDFFCVHSGWTDTALSSIGSSASLPDNEAALAVRGIIGQASAAGDVSAVDNSSCSSPVSATLFNSWRKARSDPDIFVAVWFMSGAPAGVSLLIPAAGIVPEIGMEPGIHYSDLVTTDDSASNCQDVDDEGYAEVEVQGYIDKGYLAVASSMEELTESVGGPPALNKFGIISKLRNGTAKRRMILDTKQSNVKRASSRG